MRPEIRSALNVMNPVNFDGNVWHVAVRSAELMALDIGAVIAFGWAGACVSAGVSLGSLGLIAAQTLACEHYPTNELPPWQKWRK